MTTWTDGLKSDELPECLMMDNEMRLARGMNLIRATKIPQIRRLIERRDYLEEQLKLSSPGYSDSWELLYVPLGMQKSPHRPISISRDVVKRLLTEERDANTAALEALGVDPWS